METAYSGGYADIYKAIQTQISGQRADCDRAAVVPVHNFSTPVHQQFPTLWIEIADAVSSKATTASLQINTHASTPLRRRLSVS